MEDKVRRALADEYATKQVEVASLCKIKDELNNSQNRLKSSLAQLDKDNTELTNLCESLKEEHNTLVKVLIHFEKYRCNGRIISLKKHNYLLKNHITNPINFRLWKN